MPYVSYIILSIKATRWEKYFVCTIFSCVCVVKLYVQIKIEVFNPLIIYCTFCILLLFISSTFFTKTNHMYCTFFSFALQDRCLQVNLMHDRNYSHLIVEWIFFWYWKIIMMTFFLFIYTYLWIKRLSRYFSDVLPMLSFFNGLK